MNAMAAIPVASATLAAMESCMGAVDDMTALSRRTFTRFLEAYPDEATRFINVDAAVLRMTDETFILLLGLASGAEWAAGSARHWADLHRNYGPIASARYAAWTALCLDELAVHNDALWTASVAGWQAAGGALDALLISENDRVQGISHPAAH